MIELFLLHNFWTSLFIDSRSDFFRAFSQCPAIFLPGNIPTRQYSYPAIFLPGKNPTRQYSYPAKIQPKILHPGNIPPEFFRPAKIHPAIFLKPYCAWLIFALICEEFKVLMFLFFNLLAQTCSSKATG